MAKTKQDLVRRGFLFSKGMDGRLLEIQEHLEMRNLTSVIEYCLNYVYQKELNNYVAVAKNRTPRVPMTTEERVSVNMTKYEDRKKAEYDIKREKCLELAEQLEAKIETDSAGNETARWNVYEKDTPNYVAVGQLAKPLLDLLETHVETQYRGASKEDIKKTLAEQNK